MSVLPFVPPPAPRSDWYINAMEELVHVVQALSHARDINSVAVIVRDAARNLTGADGASFVLRDGNHCYYVDENAIAPLWKGLRFPMDICVSGWCMLHAEQVVIEDIYADPRVPTEAYKPTFVKSLAMVPIRKNSPIGAIGNYWATNRVPSAEELAILQALADTTSVALENAQLYTELQQKIHDLNISNHELKRFAWVASHDLQEPLRNIATYVELVEQHAQMDAKGHQYIHLASQGASRLQHLIDALLVHAQIEKQDTVKTFEMTPLLTHTLTGLKPEITNSRAKITYDALPRVQGDSHLLTLVLEHLLSNALKFKKPDVAPIIHIGCTQRGDQWVFSVRDNGIGMSPEYAQSIFELFYRLHEQDAYPGAGIGLATCRKIIALHNGEVSVESTPDVGSTFFFTLPIGIDRKFN